MRALRISRRVSIIWRSGPWVVAFHPFLTFWPKVSVYERVWYGVSGWTVWWLCWEAGRVV